jgi:hypothetical protein
VLSKSGGNFRDHSSVVIEKRHRDSRVNERAELTPYARRETRLEFSCPANFIPLLRVLSLPEQAVAFALELALERLHLAQD